MYLEAFLQVFSTVTPKRHKKNDCLYISAKLIWKDRNANIPAGLAHHLDVVVGAETLSV